MCHTSGENNSKTKHGCSDVQCRSLGTPKLQDHVMVTAGMSRWLCPTHEYCIILKKPREANSKRDTVRKGKRETGKKQRDESDHERNDQGGLLV